MRLRALDLSISRKPERPARKHAASSWTTKAGAHVQRRRDRSGDRGAAQQNLSLSPDDVLPTTLSTQRIAPLPAGAVSMAPGIPESVSPLDPTVAQRPIQLEASFDASESSTNFSLTNGLDSGQEQYNLTADPRQSPITTPKVSRGGKVEGGSSHYV